jgi:hydroxymethylpyrimidine pyrophosphatase-like HAD family hydrolase
MERQYAKHMHDVETQIGLSSHCDITRLEALIRSCLSQPSIVIGSGGSAVNAHLFSYLFEKSSSFSCTVMTPLEFAFSNVDCSSFSIWLFSAEGKNPDIIRAFGLANTRGMRVVSVLNHLNTPIEHEAIRANQEVVILPVPYKDGFLATISTVYTTVNLCRAFEAPPFEKKPDLQLRLFKQEHEDQSHFIIVYAPSLKCAAIDFETRCHESGLAYVQLADLRNFAHGRHFGAYKNKQDSHVLILSDDKLKDMALETYSLVKDCLTSSLLSFGPHSENTQLNAIFFSMLAFGAIAEKKQQEPNIVDVPDFGRSLYQLATGIDNGSLDSDKSFSPDPKETQEQTLSQTRFSAVVFDYDGTLCRTRERFEPLDDRIKYHLKRLLDADIPIGIATGRGKSVAKQLREALPINDWSKVYVGYYNGAVIKTLDCELNQLELQQSPSLEMLFEAFMQSNHHNANILVDLRTCQLTLTFENNTMDKVENIFEYLHILSVRLGIQVKILKSTHSIDVVESTTTKLSVIKHVSDLVEYAVLAIGDNGQFGGNDFDLLSHQHSLSVNRASKNGVSGRKHSPNSLIELDATLWHLDRLTLNETYFNMSFN